MSITLRPYPKDPTRFHVDLQIKHPVTSAAMRRRIASPPGLDELRARRWGEGQLGDWLRTLVSGKEDLPKVPHPAPATPKVELTLELFYREHFTPTYVRMQRSATQVAYDTLWRNHLTALGSMPLAAIDEGVIDRFKADLSSKGLEASTINLILAKLVKMLRWALKHKRITAVPVVDRVKVQAKPRAHYSVEQITELRKALADLSPEDAAVFCLAFEGGLRTGEIAALCWEDVDLAQGIVHVRRTIHRGVEGPPKGTVGEIALTANMQAAVSRLERRGRRVLYRCSQHTRRSFDEHTEHSVRAALNRIQRSANLGETGLHILRHSGITFLADQGADVYTVRAFARHSRLQTTEAYIHQAARRLARGAARLFDGNDLATEGNQAGKTPPSGS